MIAHSNRPDGRLAVLLFSVLCGFSFGRGVVIARQALPGVEAGEEHPDFKQTVHRNGQQCLREYVRRRQQHAHHEGTHQHIRPFYASLPAW